MEQSWKYPILHIFYHIGCYYSKLKRTKENVQSASAANVSWYSHPHTRELKINSPTTKPGAIFVQRFPGYGGDPCNREKESTCMFNQTLISELPPSHMKALTRTHWTKMLHQQTPRVRSIISSETQWFARGPSSLQLILHISLESNAFSLLLCITQQTLATI